MRCLDINKRTIWYATFNTEAETTSSSIVSREKTISYNAPVSDKMCVSPASGLVTLEGNGLHTEYTHVMVTDDMSCPINVDTLVWVYKTPSTTTSTDADYRVTYVSKGLNNIKYGLREIVNG